MQIAKRNRSRNCSSYHTALARVAGCGGFSARVHRNAARPYFARPTLLAVLYLASAAGRPTVAQDIYWAVGFAASYEAAYAPALVADSGYCAWDVATLGTSTWPTGMQTVACGTAVDVYRATEPSWLIYPSQMTQVETTWVCAIAPIVDPRPPAAPPPDEKPTAPPKDAESPHDDLTIGTPLLVDPDDYSHAPTSAIEPPRRSVTRPVDQLPGQRLVPVRRPNRP